MLGGQVAAAVLPAGDVLPYVKTGKLRVLAVTHATPLLPGIASFADVGLGTLAISDFLAVYGPAGLPTATVDRLNAAIRQVAAQSEVAEQLASYGMQAHAGTPQELAAEWQASNSQIDGLIQAIGYQPQ